VRHRRPFVAGNWKMNPPTIADAVLLARGVVDATAAAVRVVEVAIAPPYPALLPVRDAVRGSDIAVAAQDVHEHEKGAYTGGVSAAMLRGLVSYAIVGHSEVRRDRGDTDARVNAKLRRALGAGLRPILCVGEALEVRRRGDADDFVRTQVRAALAGVSPDEAPRCVIAYEPVWAIGTGVPARGEDARATIAAVREELGALFGGATAHAIRVLYGGSVTADSVAEFAEQPGIDGALVGGASLAAEEFARICAAVELARTRA
jgi:triosephosphate isomerase